MRSFPNSGANRGGWRNRLWSGKRAGRPGSESKDLSENILQGKVHTGGVRCKVSDAVTLKSISFPELSVGGTIDGLSVLLSDLELLEVRGEDARGSDRLVVINKHDPPWMTC